MWGQIISLKLIWRLNRRGGKEGSWGLRKIRYCISIWLNGNLDVEPFKPLLFGRGGLCNNCRCAPLWDIFFSPFFFFDVVTPNLLLPWQTNERPVHVWQLISLAGGKQLDTANGGWQRSDVKSMRQSCICDQEGLCESISKIIHFAVATHFRLPVPIMDLSGEGDRAGRGVAWGRFCLICHQGPGDPHPLSCPLSTCSSIFSPIHGTHISPAQQQQYALKRMEGPIVTQRVLCCLSRAWQWLHWHARKLYQISEVQRTEFLFVLNQQKYTVKNLI